MLNKEIKTKLKEYLREEVLNEMGTNRKDALNKIHFLSDIGSGCREFDSKISHILKYYYFEPETTENDWLCTILSAFNTIFSITLKSKHGKFSKEVLIDAIIYNWGYGNVKDIRPNTGMIACYFENHLFQKKYNKMSIRGYSYEAVGQMFIKFVINIVQDFYCSDRKLTTHIIKEYLDKQLI